MRRLVDRDLEAWASSSRRKPLVVRGARQVGKTYSIREQGRKRFDRVVTIDLERNRDWHRAFGENLDARRVLADLEVLAGTKIEPGRTLLFLDEVQACPRALTALRYFHEEIPELHVVAAGSLLEFALGEFPVPVGRIQYLEMHPMTLLETLWATGNDAAAEVVSGPPGPLAEATHRFLLDEVRRYCFVGGMPEAVQAHVASRSLQEAFAVQKELCETYRADFSRYAPRSDLRCLDEVFLSVARQVGSQVHYSRLTQDFSGPTARSAVELLARARVIRKVPSCDPSGLPLGARAHAKRFKTILLDVGMWQHLSGMKVAAEYGREDLLGVYRGAMAEQFVGQEMAVSQGSDLFYWAREERGSTAEVDYLAVIDGAVHGVEVKSGAAGSLKSLHLLLRSFPTVAEGRVFQAGPYAELPEARLRFLPLYWAFTGTGGRVPGS
jgi:hypothetical protein